MQPAHLMRKSGACIAVESVGNQQHKCPLTQQPARPQPVEFGEAMTDAGAARPVDDRLGDAFECEIDIAMTQIAGDVGEPRAEYERVDAIAVVGHRVHEMQKYPAV